MLAQGGKDPTDNYSGFYLRIPCLEHCLRLLAACIRYCWNSETFPRHDVMTSSLSWPWLVTPQSRQAKTKWTCLHRHGNMKSFNNRSATYASNPWLLENLQFRHRCLRQRHRGRVENRLIMRLSPPCFSILSHPNCPVLHRSSS